MELFQNFKNMTTVIEGHLESRIFSFFRRRGMMAKPKGQKEIFFEKNSIFCSNLDKYHSGAGRQWLGRVVLLTLTIVVDEIRHDHKMKNYRNC